MMQQRISDSELELMKIIWGNGGRALYATIMDELDKSGNEWKKNTVLTLLSRLIDKGFLTIHKIGRRNEYIALVGEKDYLTTQTKNFLDKVYEGDVTQLISTLVHQDMMSSDDFDTIKKFWREKHE